MNTMRQGFKQLRQQNRQLVMIAILLGVELLMTLTPIGFIHLGIIKLTLIHLPVLVGAFLLGPKAGLILGGGFGVLSLLTNTLAPSLVSFAFSPFIPVWGQDRGSAWALLVCLLPRLFFGWFSGWLFSRLALKQNPSPMVWAILPILLTLLHTLSVIFALGLFFGESLSGALVTQTTHSSLWAWFGGLILLHGLPEAVAAGLVIPVFRLFYTRMKLQKNMERPL